jgi:hypothetical protein
MLTRIAMTVAFAGVASLLGCAADATGGATDPAADPAPASNESLVHRDSVSGIVGGVGEILGICQPLTCCFPSGGGWGADAFENGLRALGCTTPAAYSQSAGQDDWWLYTQCPASAKLTQLVGQYSKVAPYYAQPVLNECLVLNAVTELKLNSVFVQFDPTCNTCKPAR